MAKRNRIFPIRLTEEEFQKLKQRAEEMELFIASYIRKMIFQKGVIKNG